MSLSKCRGRGFGGRGAGLARFVDLGRRLTAFSPDTAGWQVYRSIGEGETGGLSLVDDPEAVKAFQMKRGYNDFDGTGMHSATAETYLDGAFGRKSLAYRWGGGSPESLKLKLDAARFIVDGFGLERFLRLTDILIQFQRPKYLFAGDWKYFSDGHHLFAPDRVPASWICWVPQSVSPDLIPSAHLVEGRHDGNLIVTQRDFFNVNDNPVAIGRANAVETEMNEAGVLPEMLTLSAGQP